MFKNIQNLESRIIYQNNGDLAHKDGIYTLCRLNNSCLASSSVDKSIRFWNWKGQTLITNLDSDGCCRYFVCEDNMLVGTSENSVIIIDWHSRNIQGVVPCANKLYSLLIFKHSTILAGDCYGNINIINNQNLIRYIGNFEENPDGHKGSVNTMHKINIFPNLFFTAGEFGQIKVWDNLNFQLKGEMIGHDKDKSVYCLDSYFFAQQSNIENQDDLKNYFLISGSSDKTIRIWNLQTFQQTKVIQLISPIYTACMINLSEIVIGDGNNIRIINIHDQEKDISIEKHESRVNAICKLSQTSFASGDIEGHIINWSLKKPSIQIQNHKISEQEVEESINSSLNESIQDQKKKNSFNNIQNNKDITDKQTQNLLSYIPDNNFVKDYSENQATIKKYKPESGYEESVKDEIHNTYKIPSQLQQSHIEQKNQEQININSNTQNQQKNEDIQINIKKDQIHYPSFLNMEDFNSNSVSNLKTVNNQQSLLSPQNDRQLHFKKLSAKYFKDHTEYSYKNIERGRTKNEKLNQITTQFNDSDENDTKKDEYNEEDILIDQKHFEQQNQQQQIITSQTNSQNNSNNQGLSNTLVIKDQDDQYFDQSNQFLKLYSETSKNEKCDTKINKQLSENSEKNNSNCLNYDNLDSVNSSKENQYNSSKFQNLNSTSFAELLKQFDDNDKYQIIHEKKKKRSISPMMKIHNTNRKNYQQNKINENSANKKQISNSKTKNKEPRNIHMNEQSINRNEDGSIYQEDQLQSQVEINPFNYQNKSQYSEDSKCNQKRESISNSDKNSQNSPMSHQQIEEDNEYNLEIQQDQKSKQIMQNFIDDKTNEESYSKQFNNSQKNNKQEEILNLFEQNQKFKEQSMIQNQQIEKYQEQIQKLIDTLQNQEDERIQIVNQIKQITPQLQQYSQITNELREKSETKQMIIQRQDVEIRVLKKYAIDLQSKVYRLKQSQSNRSQYEEEMNFNQVERNSTRIKDETKQTHISQTKDIEPDNNCIQQGEEYNQSKNINDFITIKDNQNCEDISQKQSQTSQNNEKNIYANELQINENDFIAIKQYSSSELGQDQIGKLSILEYEALQLLCEKNVLKQKINKCEDDLEMIELLNEIQSINQQYDLKNDEIAELKIQNNIE